jgi:hypothetical protein
VCIIVFESKPRKGSLAKQSSYLPFWNWVETFLKTRSNTMTIAASQGHCGIQLNLIVNSFACSKFLPIAICSPQLVFPHTQIEGIFSQESKIWRYFANNTDSRLLLKVQLWNIFVGICRYASRQDSNQTLYTIPNSSSQSNDFWIYHFASAGRVDR